MVGDLSSQKYKIFDQIINLLWFNLMRVEIRELRPEVVTEDDGVLVHY